MSMVCHPLSTLKGTNGCNQLFRKSLALREFSDNKDLAKSSLCTPQSQVCLWIRTTVAVPEVIWLCLRVLPHIKVSGHYVSQRHALLGDKTWGHLGLSGCMRWISHVPKEWNSSIQSSLPECFALSHRSNIIGQWVLTMLKYSCGPGSRLEISLVYIVWSVVKQSSLASSVLPYSQWQGMAHTACMRSSGSISLQKANYIPFSLPSPQR